MATQVTRPGWWRTIFDPVASSNDRTTVLSGPTLRVVRAAVLAMFGAAVVVFAADLFALWDEAQATKFHSIDGYGNRQTTNFYGLTGAERLLLGDSRTETPGWYPVYVVIRQALVVTVSVWIAWLIYSRRPRHWMAYATTLFVLMAPGFAYPDQTNDRLAGTAMYWPSEVLGWIAILVFLSFLWTFPDGRFIGSVARYVVTAVAFVVLFAFVGQLVDAVFSPPDEVVAVVGGVWWMALMGAILLWFALGVGLQSWRYGRTPADQRRLARWNLAVLIAIPLWILPFQALHDLFSDSDVGRYTMSGFVWEQFHETLFVVAPALFALWILFLVRRQGWWDFQTLWNRTAVYGIGLFVLAGLYGAAFGLVSLVTTPLASNVEQVVAVTVATAAVAFAYGPLLRRTRRYVDEHWFPRRAEVDAVSAAFAEHVRAAPDPSTAGDRLLEAVRTSLGPAHADLWNVTDGGGR